MSVILVKATTVRLLSRPLSLCGKVRSRTWSMSPSPRKQSSIGSDDHDEDGQKKLLAYGPSFDNETKTKVHGGDDPGGQNKKSDERDKVLLLGHEGSRIGLMSFTAAQRLAKRRNLKLVSMAQAAAANDSRQLRHQVYKLITGDQLHEQRLAIRQSQKAFAKEGTHPWTVKGETSLIVGTRIGEHDLRVKMKNVQSWLQKGRAVHVTINGDQSTVANMEQIYENLEKTADEVGGHALQKRIRGDDGHVMKFTLQMSKTKIEAREKQQQTANKTSNPEQSKKELDESW